MLTPLTIVQLLVLLLLAVSALESLRARPWWPQSPARPVSRGPARGTSPRERRWIHGGLAVLLAASLLVSPEVAEQEGWVAGAAIGLLVVGTAAVVVGYARGPSEADRADFAARIAPTPGEDADHPDAVWHGDGAGEGSPGSSDQRPEEGR